jgi:hypothetical protein
MHLPTPLWLPHSNPCYASHTGPAADDVASLDWRGLRSFVVVLLGKDAPQRRAPEQPFLTTDPPGLLPLDAINKAAAAYEAAVNRTLFPIKIQMADMAALAKQAMGDKPDDRPPCEQVCCWPPPL